MAIPNTADNSSLSDIPAVPAAMLSEAFFIE